MARKSVSDLRLSRREATTGLLAIGGALLLACSQEDAENDSGASNDGVLPSGTGSTGADASTSVSDAGGSTDNNAAGHDASTTSADATADNSATGHDAGTTSADATASNHIDGSVTQDSGVSADSGSPANDAGSAASWAGSGTKSMSGNYPDPFIGTSTGCVLAVAATEGPCTESADQVRKDISEGYTGLPMRLALRVVDSACNPIAGAKVKIWHTQITGSYSGNTPNNGMCLKIASDSSKHYFRGVQTSDAQGRVDFDSCFPGWYRGRCIHIHFTVSAGGKSFTSQLVFEQSLINEIFTTHSEYKPYGLPDTSNATDNVVGNGNLASYTVSASRMSDGAMLAAKQLVVSLS